MYNSKSTKSKYLADKISKEKFSSEKFDILMGTFLGYSCPKYLEENKIKNISTAYSINIENVGVNPSYTYYSHTARLVKKKYYGHLFSYICTKPNKNDIDVTNKYIKKINTFFTKNNIEYLAYVDIEKY